MFKVLKAVLNNLNEKKYLKSLNNLEFRENAIEDNNSNNPVEVVDKNQVISELETLQDIMRHDNLQIYATNMLRARGKQFLIVTLPAVLTLSTALLWFLPANRVKSEKLDTYSRVETVISDNRQIEIEDPTLYYSTFFGRNFVDEEKAKDLTTTTNKRIELYITSELNGFLAKLNIGSDGSLSISDIDSGTYLNLNDYDFSDAKELDSKYSNLFDTVIDLMLESSYINDEQKEELKALSESDKKEIVATIIEYNDLGKTNVDVYKSNWFWRIALAVITGIYIWVLGYIRKEDGPWESYELTNNNGDLVESDNTEQIGLFHLGTKYKEAFLAAERDRIKRVYELCDKNLYYTSRDNVMTKYEKTLVLGSRKDR